MSTQARHDAAYQTIANELRDALRRGAYRGGLRLPTEADLAAHHSVSRQTVRRAFHDLVSEGLVQRVRGRGTFATEYDGRYLRQFGSIEDLMSLSVDTTMEIVEPLHQTVDVAVARRLQVADDIVHTISFRRLFQDTAFTFTTVHLRADLASGLQGVAELATKGRRSDVTMIGVLQRELGVVVAEAEQSITAATADPSIARALGCAVDHTLLRIDRLYLGNGGVPLELATAYFLPEHYSYRVRLRRGAR